MQITKSFSSISLDQMDKVKLMNRIDRKYWFNASSLQTVLEEIKNDYYILEISGETAMPYSTIYFDTPENSMFIAHHNGKLNRYKIRKRNYVISDMGFLEIKFKNNKGRTIKRRIPTNNFKSEFSEQEKHFIKQSTPFIADYLNLSLHNKFTRITLVNKNLKERCTIDLNLEFTFKNKHLILNDLAVVEIKADGRSKNSALSLAMRDFRLKASGFSKYCIGKSIVDTEVKRNAFKAKLRYIEKETNTNLKIN
ncbi:MAG: hypothetical protein C0595_11040 [Marinilabiliales bacterium]|nr:MAG: hypothetical protein C0595_11040 [Marinilabiliales bacterium]